MAFDQDLAKRVRAALQAVPVREVNMFGGLSFLVDESLAVGVRGQGGLLVRCDPDQVDELLQRPEAEWAKMGARSMKQGWLQIDADALDDEVLAFWVDTALAYNDRTA